MYTLSGNEDFDQFQEIPTYEEVARLLPDPTCPRPIVLVGPPGVGRNELKRRLIALDPDKFRTTIPCESLFFQEKSLPITSNSNRILLALRYFTSSALR